MHLHAALHDDKAQSGARHLTGIASAMEGAEKLLLVGGGNADTLVLYAEDSLPVVPLEIEIDCGSAVRVLDGIRQQVRQNMSQETLITIGGRQRFSMEADGAFVLCRCLDLVDEALANAGQVERDGLEFKLSRLRPANEEHVFHHFGHLASRLNDVIELRAALFGLQALEVAIEVFCRRQNHAQRSSELVRYHRDEAAAQLVQLTFGRQSMVELSLRALALDHLGLQLRCPLGNLPAQQPDPYKCNSHQGDDGC